MQFRWQVQISAFLHCLRWKIAWWVYSLIKLAAPPLHTVGVLGDLKLDTWEAELGDDMDREYLVQGIKNGFHILSNFDFAHAECDNYNSALDPSIHDAVELQIKTEISEGRYVITNTKPVIVSALGAVKKSGGGIRLIHGASRPLGHALNDYAQMEYKLSFQSLIDAEKLIKPNVFMIKVDLKSALESTLMIIVLQGSNGGSTGTITTPFCLINACHLVAVWLWEYLID